MNKLYFSYAARADLADIRGYISFELANPSAAKKTLSLIMKSINMLRDFANAGASLSSIASVHSDYHK
jgi:plasmid stabilization system protein ParE